MSASVGVTLAVLVAATVFCAGSPVGERVKSGNCDSCRPDSTCRASDVLARPDFFASSCCGRCGPGAMEDWCASLTLEERHIWNYGDRKICPWKGYYWQVDGGRVLRTPLCSECQPQQDCSWFGLTPNATGKVLEKEIQCCIPCGEVWLWSWCKSQCSVGGYCELEERLCSKFEC